MVGATAFSIMTLSITVMLSVNFLGAKSVIAGATELIIMTLGVMKHSITIQIMILVITPVSTTRLALLS